MTNKLCACGCGKEIIIKSYHKYRGIPEFISGHNSRVKSKTSGQFKKGQTAWNKGKNMKTKSRQKLSESVKTLWTNKQYREKVLERRKEVGQRIWNKGLNRFNNNKINDLYLKRFKNLNIEEFDNLYIPNVGKY